MWEMRRNAQKFWVLGRNVVTERVGTTVLQLYLIWTSAKVLEFPRVPGAVLRLPRLNLPNMKFFVTLVDRLRAANYSSLCWGGFRYVPVKQLLGLIMNIKIELISLMIWILVWSELLTNLAINYKIPIVLIIGLPRTTIFWSWNILEFEIVKIFLGCSNIWSFHF